MDMSNPLYKNQGIHVDIATFSIEEGVVKVLLIMRGNAPFKGEWMMPGGAVYNNESTDNAAIRELKEKTGLEGVHLEQFYAFSDPNRDPRMRMISIGYLALIDKNSVKILQKTPKTINAEWFDINKIPPLVFDHNEILQKALNELRKTITKTNLVKVLLSKEFTLVELQKIYEAILGNKFDRRNFRRKFLNLGLIKPTGSQKEANGHRPAYFYRFADDEYKEIEIF